MPKTKTYAQPPLEFLPPKFNPLVLRLCQILMPLWMAGKTPIADIQIEQGDRIIELFQQFQASKIRFLLAFRHPNPNDPIALSQVFWRRIPAWQNLRVSTFRTPCIFILFMIAVFLCGREIS